MKGTLQEIKQRFEELVQHRKTREEISNGAQERLVAADIKPLSMIYQIETKNYVLGDAAGFYQENSFQKVTYEQKDSFSKY